MSDVVSWIAAGIAIAAAVYSLIIAIRTHRRTRKNPTRTEEN